MNERMDEWDTLAVIQIAYFQFIPSYAQYTQCTHFGQFVPFCTEQKLLFVI